MNRNVPPATVTLPTVRRNVPAKIRPKVTFNARFFRDAQIFLTSKRPDLGNSLMFQEILVTEGDANAVAFLYMTKRTYEDITDDDDDYAISAVQKAIEGARVGVQAKMVDASTLPRQAANPVPLVDRSPDTVAEKNKGRDGFEVFVEQVAGLFLDLQGFDYSKMTDEDRNSILVRYGKLRDRAAGYRRLVAQMEGSFEVIQKAVMEMVNADE